MRRWERQTEDAASVVLKLLRATWFGSVLALLWLAILIVIPSVHYCIAIAAVRGGSSGIICGSTPPLENPSGLGLLLLLLFAGVIVAVPLVFPYRPVLLLVGIGSAAVVVAMIVISPDFGRYLALSQLGLPLRSEAQSALLLLLPASLVWVIAGFRAGRKSPFDARRHGRIAPSSPS